MSEAVKITLETRHYGNGAKARGDRNIVIGGAVWGHVRMVGHGRHGPSYEFYDAAGHGIAYKYDDGKLATYRLESVDGARRRWRGLGPGDSRSTEERIIDKARELIDANRLRDPATVAAQQKRAARAREAMAQAANEKERRMRVTLLSLAGRADLTADEVAGLHDAYTELFHAKMETVK